MAHRVSGRVQAFELDGLADVDDIAGAHAAVHVRDALTGVLVGNDLGTGRPDHALVAARMVPVLVGVQDLSDMPALVTGNGEAFLVLEGVDGQRLARLGAGDQVIEIAVGVAGPDLLHDHGVASPCAAKTRCPPTQVSSTRMSSISEAGISK